MKAFATALLALAAGATHAQDTPPACPAPHELRAAHLYGAWRAQWPDAPDRPTATLRLERHEELTDSVRGRVERDGVSAQVVGDANDGDFTLEESLDGQRISANWIGEVVEGSCGKEIRGVWTDGNTGTQRAFILRRQGGWQ
ncbi:hypothetical protein [Pseudorhodoferax sp. Leaf267]|uniref:hypothetical protein n=1 Tax=Pseudorhodoferax sp. Leaf267 TaxID=1736316 RepID=UPI0006FCAF20|nr:hypothetical protein [Pseudorhodoferax sp. Leaf267]KQP12249.1 hypothetical protein ASF43_22335 [Pseudorhodoferax sp. Leaf267]